MATITLQHGNKPFAKPGLGALWAAATEFFAAFAAARRIAAAVEDRTAADPADLATLGIKAEALPQLR